MNARYNSNLAFVDLLFNLILGFAFLFIVAFFLINDPTEDKDVEAKVEYMIIMAVSYTHLTLPPKRIV